MKIPKELTTVTLLSKCLALVVFLVAPVIAFGLGVQYQQAVDLAVKQQADMQIQIPPRVPTPTLNRPINASPSAETDNWKMHTSVCGFSFKYPQNYTVSTSQTCIANHHQDGFIQSPDNGKSLWVNISVDSNPKSTNFQDEINSYIGWGKLDQVSTAIAGYPAIESKILPQPINAGINKGVNTGALILKDGKFFQFNVTGDETSVKIWYQILSTFKFTQ